MIQHKAVVEPSIVLYDMIEFLCCHQLFQEYETFEYKHASNHQHVYQADRGLFLYVGGVWNKAWMPFVTSYHVHQHLLTLAKPYTLDK